MNLKPEELMDAAIWLVYNLDKKNYDKSFQIVEEISKRLNFGSKTKQDFHLAVLAALRNAHYCWEVEVHESIRKKFLPSASGQLFNDAMLRVIDEVCGKDKKKGGSSERTKKGKS